MTAKEYLSQVHRIDKMVTAKLEQVQVLRNSAERATSTLSDIPPSGTRNIHRMEDIIVKLLDLEDEVKADINALVDLRREIMATIKAVEKEDYRILLELRYLCFKPWEDIAITLRYSKDHIFSLHRKALDVINITVKGMEKQ